MKGKKITGLILALGLVFITLTSATGGEGGESGAPFWGINEDNCELVGDIMGGFSDAPCYQAQICSYHVFWIPVGWQNTEPQEVPCPE